METSLRIDMTASIQQPNPRTKNPTQSVRERPLRLAGFPSADRYGTLPNDHPAYPLAAALYHHGARLDAPAGRALLAVLLEQWPQKRGRHDTAFDDTRAAFAHLVGASPSEIAAAWGIEPNSAEKKIRRGTAASQPKDYGTPRIEIVDDYLIVQDHELTEPGDPATRLDQLLSREPSPEQWRESRARLADAAAMGLPEFVTINVLLHAGRISVVGAPTASREAAWRVIDRAVLQHGGYGSDIPCGLTGDDEHAQRFATWLLAERREHWP